MAQTVKWDSKLKPEENASRMLPPMLTAWFEAGRGVHEGPVDPAALL